jgi:hypothetical protein
MADEVTISCKFNDTLLPYSGEKVTTIKSDAFYRCPLHTIVLQGIQSIDK